MVSIDLGRPLRSLGEPKAVMTTKRNAYTAARAIFQTPMSLLDTTPAGLGLNRFSSSVRCQLPATTCTSTPIERLFVSTVTRQPRYMCASWFGRSRSTPIG